MKIVSSLHIPALNIHKRTLAFAAATALFAALQGSYAFASVVSTKHNLGKLSPAAVKSESTSEICIFCHTPHNSYPEYPIWNQELPSGATYNPYASSTLVSTLTPKLPLGQPTGSSKLCLSCHDGTIAMGSLLNMPVDMPSPGTFTVTGPGVTDGKLTSATVSYLGTELGDDHPISFQYSLAFPDNAELKTSTPSFTPNTVKLDRGGEVQCTSCHDPHGTANPKFLVASTANGALCETCHDKLYWPSGKHKTSTATWNSAGQNPWYEDMGASGFGDDTPALQSCLACHRSHGGVVNKSLLRGTDPGTSLTVDEEWTCLNCHNGNVPPAKNVNVQFDYAYKHDVKGVSGIHAPSRSAAGEPVTETAVKLGDRHVECADCHNPHGAQVGNHTVGGATGYAIGPNLIGSWGVIPTAWPATFTYATTYNVQHFNDMNPPNLEGYLCLKCHSYYAYSTLPPDVPSGGADGLQTVESDISKDMNPNNMAFHPAFAMGKNQPPILANPNWPTVGQGAGLGLTNTFNFSLLVPVGLTTVTHTGTIACTDCHGSSVAADPKGAHGSNNKWILRSNETGAGTAANFCYNCHVRDVYGDEGYTPPLANYSRVNHPVDGNTGLTSPQYAPGAGTGNNGNKFGILCLTCHGGFHDTTTNEMVAIHGSSQAAGTQAGSQALGYRLMNGACVESYTPDGDNAGNPCGGGATTQIWFLNAAQVAASRTCNSVFANIAAGNACNYTCNATASCNPN